jgi:HAE1 family hydrophobic/amphiphilic exporter-1
MGILFESFWLPWSILFTIPLAGLGVIWIHLMLGLDIDFLGAVGIVILVGVVVNNGIVLVDYINRLRLQGVERGQALLLATERRFRPIMMTAITTVGGMVPLAINGRMDSGISYTSFALTLIGGMTTATLLTLLVVPVFYTLVDDFRVWLSGMSRFLHLSRSRRGAMAISGAATAAPPDAA